MNKQAKLKQDQDVAKDDLTIILSYPHVYRFKPICYGMIVAVLNCHSSVITIMEKNDNILCINYTIKTGTVREQVFCQKQLAKPLETRVYPPQRPGCGRGADPGLREAFAGVWGCLSAVLDAFLCPVFASFPAKKVVLYLNASVLSMVII